MSDLSDMTGAEGVAAEERARFCDWFRCLIDPDRHAEYRGAHWDVVRALLTQGQADAVDGNDPAPIATQDLWRLVLEERGESAVGVTPGKARNRLHAHWAVLETEFTELEGRFADAARKSGFDGLYWPRKDESPGGRPSTYWLDWRPLGKSFQEPALPAAFDGLRGMLRYHEDKSSLRFSFLGRVFLLPLLFTRHSAEAMRIEGRRRYVPALALATVALLIGWFVLVALLPAAHGGLHWGLILAAAACYWAFLHPLVRLYDSRIIMASPLLYPFNERDCQIQLSWDAARSDTARARGYSLRLVRYAAECPLCRGKVWLRDGGIEYFNRLVGRCDEEPGEHVFSFDQKLRAGYWLRAPHSRDG